MLGRRHNLRPPPLLRIAAPVVLAKAQSSEYQTTCMVGYLIAGIVMGPFTPGYVGDQNVANELAEIGVILLMFGVGLHFSLDDLLSVKTIAIPGAIVQMAVATLLGVALAWGLEQGIETIAANGVDSEAVRAANLKSARCLLVAIPDAFEGWQVVQQARALNPGLLIVARSHSQAENEHPLKHGPPK